MESFSPEVVLLGFIHQLELRLAVEEVEDALKLGIGQESWKILAAPSVPNAENDLIVLELGLLDRLAEVRQRFAISEDHATPDYVANLLERVSDLDSNLRHIRVLSGVGQISNTLYLYINVVSEFCLG